MLVPRQRVRVETAVYRAQTNKAGDDLETLLALLKREQILLTNNHREVTEGEQTLVLGLPLPTIVAHQQTEESRPTSPKTYPRGMISPQLSSVA